MNSKVYKSPRPVKAGNLMIGGGFPLSVQTMWKEPLHEVSDALVDRIDTLVSMGLDILRFAVPDMETVSALKALAPRVKIPLVADIHFDYKLALASIAAGVSKVRINPGNIGAPWKVEEVVRAARDSDVAIRVGINAGSLPVVLRKENDRAKALISAAEAELDILERLGFHAVVFSLKSSDIESTIAANERFASLYDYPLHLGVTEAGPLIGGVVKSTVALSRLLQEGVGSTIRVSLSDEPESEVIAGREILSSLALRTGGVKIVSCPRCGRAGFDVHWFIEEMGQTLYSLGKDITVAVMGCEVNGPGEARHADIGITGTGNSIVIFRHGEVVRRVAKEEALSAFKEELKLL